MCIKCYQAGFKRIWLISESRSHLEKIKASLPEDLFGYVELLTLNQAVEKIKSIRNDTKKMLVRGFTMIQHSHEIGDSERKRREIAFAKAVEFE